MNDGLVDGGEVVGDGVGGALHQDDGVSRVDEVTVASTDQLTELLLLRLDLPPGSRFHIANLGDRFRAEQGFRIPNSLIA